MIGVTARAPLSTPGGIHGVTQSLDQVSTVHARIRLQMPVHIIIELNWSKTVLHFAEQYD